LPERYNTTTEGVSTLNSNVLCQMQNYRLQEVVKELKSFECVGADRGLTPPLCAYTGL